jgi:modulator of FtsH protease HflC
MRANSIGVIVIAAVVLALFAAYGSLFTVYQTKQALVVRLGEPVPGYYRARSSREGPAC